MKPKSIVADAAGVGRSRGMAERMAAAILEQIERGEMTPGDKLPSRAVLARRFNVSLPTVTVAIRRLSQKGVVEFIPGRGIYLAGNAEGRRKTFKIGLIGWFASHYASSLPRFNTYWLGIFKSLVHQAGVRGYSITVIPDTDAEPVDVDMVLAHQPNVVISHGIRLSPETIGAFRKSGMPLLLGNRYDDKAGVSYVDYDTAGGFREVVRIFRERGHSRIGALVHRSSIPDAQERWRQAFFMELGLRGCPCDCTQYWKYLEMPYDTQTTKSLEDAGRKEAARLLALPHPPTALYCFSAVVAQAVADLARERGLKVGRELSIITDSSFESDSPFSMLQDPHDALAEALVETARKLADHPGEIFHVDVPKRFIDKGSVADISKGGSRPEKKAATCSA